MAGESPSGASAAPHWPRKRLPAPPPLAPGGCSLRGRVPFQGGGAVPPLPGGVRAERKRGRWMAPGPWRSLWPRLRQGPHRRPEARGKVSGVGGGREPAPRGGGGASSRLPLLASWLRSAHLPPRAALLFPPEPAPRSGWDSPAPRPGPRAPRLVTPSSPSALACSGREGSAEQGCAELGAPSGRGRKAPSLGVSVTASLPGPSG